MRYVRGRAREFRRVPSGLRAVDRLRSRTAALLAPVRQGGPGRGTPGRAGPAAHRGPGGARRGLDPAARPARRGVRPGDRRDAADLPVEPAGTGGRGGTVRPRRSTPSARRRVRTADPRWPGQERRGGLTQRRQGAGTRDAAGTRAGVDVGRSAALVRLRGPRGEVVLDTGGAPG